MMGSNLFQVSIILYLPMSYKVDSLVSIVRQITNLFQVSTIRIFLSATIDSFVAILFHEETLGYACVMRGCRNREENCSNFPCSPLFYCFVQHIFLTKKEKMNWFFSIERISNTYRRERNARFPSPVEIEIRKAWNPLIAQASS